MGSPWRNQTRDIRMSGRKEELERRIKENEKRGMVLICEPKLISNVYVSHNHDYSTLDKRKFTGKSYELQQKWVCMMRKL